MSQQGRHPLDAFGLKAQGHPQVHRWPFRRLCSQRMFSRMFVASAQQCADGIHNLMWMSPSRGCTEIGGSKRQILFHDFVRIQ